MSKAQQLLTMDEIDAGRIGEMWFEAVVDKHGLKGKPGSEITIERVNDTNIKTLWHKNQPIAIMIRQRNDWNYTVMTMVEIEPMKAELPQTTPHGAK